MPREEQALLLDMLESARDAVAFAEGLDYADFVEDRRSQLAILKAVEIVGEGRRLCREGRRHRAVPR